MQTMELCDKQLEVHMCIEKIKVMMNDLCNFFSKDLSHDEKTNAMLFCRCLDAIRTKIDITTDYVYEAERLSDILEEMLSQAHCRQKRTN